MEDATGADGAGGTASVGQARRFFPEVSVTWMRGFAFLGYLVHPNEQGSEPGDDRSAQVFTGVDTRIEPGCVSSNRLRRTPDLRVAFY